MSPVPARKSELLSADARALIDHWLDKYPADRRQSAVLAALREAQHGNGGHLTTDLIEAVADYLGLAPIEVYEVATFYSMFELKPVGRHSISVCTNISCMLCGGETILEHVEKRLGVKVGESTPDGRFFQLLTTGGRLARFTGVKLSPSPPPLVIGRGGRDGETGDLKDFLARTLDDYAR